MYYYSWYQWILFFFIYCFIGWIIESSYVSIKSGHLVNRGFLRLPLLPLYGSGAIIMLWASLPFQNNLVFVFIAGMLGASALEYVTGYVMERLFKMKYWDYSNNRFNLQGYVCLGTSIAWGLLTILLTEFIHKPVEQLVLSLYPIAAIVTVAVIGVFFILDIIESTKQALDLGRTLEAMTKMKAELEEVQLQMALLKAETSQKISDMRDDAIQMAANFKGEAAVKMTELKVETANRAAGAAAAFKENAGRGAEAVNTWKENLQKSTPDLTSMPSITALNDRLQSLNESKEKLYGHIAFYRWELLRGNPTASSRQFGEALKELKLRSQKRKSKKH